MWRSSHLVSKTFRCRVGIGFAVGNERISGRLARVNPRGLGRVHPHPGGRDRGHHVPTTASDESAGGDLHAPATDVWEHRSAAPVAGAGPRAPPPHVRMGAARRSRIGAIGSVESTHSGREGRRSGLPARFANMARVTCDRHVAKRAGIRQAARTSDAFLKARRKKLHSCPACQTRAIARFLQVPYGPNRRVGSRIGHGRFCRRLDAGRLARALAERPRTWHRSCGAYDRKDPLKDPRSTCPGPQGRPNRSRSPATAASSLWS